MNGEGDSLFKFVWTIENFQMEGLEILKSPKVCIEKCLNAMWDLEFILLMCNETIHCEPSPDSTVPFHKLKCGLKRSESSEGPDEIKINFQLVLSKRLCGHINFGDKQTEVFRKGSSVLHNQTFCANRDSFRSCQFIYVICLMSIDKKDIQRRISNGEYVSSLNSHLPKPQQFVFVWEPFQVNLQESLEYRNFRFYNSCFARTVEPVKKQKYIWSMKFIMDNYKTKHSIFAQKGICFSTYSRFPDFLITLRISEKNTIIMTIRRKDIRLPESINLFFILWISDEHMYWSEGECCRLLWSEHCVSEIVLETNKLLLRNPNFDLKACCLHLEIKITSGDPIIWTETTPLPIFYNVNESHNKAVYDARIKLDNMYKDKRFCDVTLQISDKKFEAHSAVLCLKSAVFKTIIENNMQRNEKNIVLYGVNVYTMILMLEFMYSDIVKITEFETTKKLYEAANKYKILPLQKKCALILQSNLTIENVLSLLSLSDSHGDNELKSCVFKFFVLHMKEIMALHN